MGDASRQRAPNEDLDASILAMAGVGKDIVDHVTGLGATLILTRTHAVVVREGAHFRPRSGVRAWAYGALRDVQLSSPRHGNGRLVLRTGPYPWQAVSLFIDAQHWTAAERVAGEIRIQTSRARRIEMRDEQPPAPERDR